MGVNRDITLCASRLQLAWAYLKEQYGILYPDGPRLILIETFRSAAVQLAYFNQGREKLTVVNKLRVKAGLAPISEAENRRKITFKKPGGSKHERTPSQAFDIGFVKAGKMDYSPINYQRAAAILRDAYPDVTWGADWDHDGKTSDETFVDMPHFQI